MFGEIADKNWYRLDEVARIWDCSLKLIQRLVKSGELPSTKIGQTRRVKIEHIREFEVQHKEPKIFPKPKIISPPISRLFGIEQSKEKPDLIDMMGEPEESFSHQRVDRLRGPIIYAWIRDGKCLYIGRSYNGIVRPFDKFHHQVGAGKVQDGDELLIWPVANKIACDRIEADLIAQLKPALNCKYGPTAKAS